MLITKKTDFTRKFLFGGVILIGFIPIILFIIGVYLCRKLRLFIRHRQTTSPTALDAAGLAQAHPVTDHLMSALHRLNTSTNAAP